MRVEGGRFLVTGGLGFIGRHLVRALVGWGASVVVVDRESRSTDAIADLPSNRVAVHAADVRTADLVPLLKGCSGVFHLSASADVRAAQDAPGPVFENNVLATARLLDAMRAADVTHLGFASTSTVYGEATVVPTPEDYAPLLPVSVYGASKLAAEGLLHGFAARHELAAVIWRFANVVGGGAAHGVTYDFVRKLAANPAELEIFGREPGTRKSYVHIDDVIEAMRLTWQHAERGVATFNVGTDDAITVKEVGDAVARALGLAGVRYRWSGGVDGGGWRGDIRTMQLSVEPLKALGWRVRHGSADAIYLAAKELGASR